MSIQGSLDSTGIADVMVILQAHEGAGTALSTVPHDIARHFITSPYSQDGALLELLNARRILGSPLPVASHTSAASLGAAMIPPSTSRFFAHLGIALGTVDRPGLDALQKEQGVADIVAAPQLRLIKPVRAAAAVPQNSYSWGLQALSIPQLHAQGLTGEGVLVGHLDTGVDASHPALLGAITEYAEFDALGNQRPGSMPRDSGEHGTHTAGTIAGRTVNGIRFGVAPRASLASAMVIEGGTVLARILGGMNWAVGHRIRVLSMSLGLIGYADSFLYLTRILRARGVLPVFAVGNEGAGTSRYPGNYAEALSVGALGVHGNVCDFSGSQHFERALDPTVPDLLAPGEDVVSCVPNNDYMIMSGSSMAAPHLTDLAALLMQARPGKTIDDIEQAIFRSCKLLPGMLPTRANRGVPDGMMALNLL